MLYDFIYRNVQQRKRYRDRKHVGGWQGRERGWRPTQAAPEELLRVSSKPGCGDDCTALEVYFKKHQIIHLKWVNLMACKSYFNKGEKGRKR